MIPLRNGSKNVSDMLHTEINVKFENYCSFVVEYVSVYISEKVSPDNYFLH